MPKDSLSLDYETYCDLDLTKVGSDVYCRDPSAEILMGAYRLNDGPVQQWAEAEGEPAPRELVEALDDPEVEKWAWNAAFEIAVTRHVWKRPVDVTQWRDTMVLAQLCGFPGQLEKAGPALGLDDTALKIKDGKKLMRIFSMRQKSRRKATMGQMLRTHWYEKPDKWLSYLAYNRGDVVTETTIKEKLLPFDPGPGEWGLWHLDQTINNRGLPINLEMVRNASQLYHDAYRAGFRQMQEITGLSNPMSTQQLKPWLEANGYMYDDMLKGHIKQARGYFDKKPTHWDEDQWEEYRSNTDLKDVLDLRLELSRSSIKKFDALLRATYPDGNGQFGLLRNTLQFAGAPRTARWAGRLFQAQNLPRPEKQYEKNIEIHAANVARLDREDMELIYPNTFDVLASTIRPAAQAPMGKVFIDADLNAIENRVLGWLSRCDKILNVFRNNRDPYVDFATYLFHGKYDVLMEEYRAGDSSKRTIAKPGVLGCGYMLSAGKEYEDRRTGEIEATGLLGYAWGMGVRHFTLQDAEHSVNTFRSQFSEVKDYWYGIERAAKKAITTGRSVEFDQISFNMKGDFLRMRLPSGRHLHYYKPRVEPVRAPWGKMKESITYMNQNQQKQWVRESTHPGKLTENADQAISRDLLAHGMTLAHKRYNLDIRLHVHDQIVALSDEDKAEQELKWLIECMEQPPKWAHDCPLGSAGFISKVFKKD